MKRKTVLSLLLIFALIFTAIPVTAFAAGTGVKIADAFPDANFRAYVEERCDTDKDGYLSTAEINAVTYLEVQRKGIQSLKGVELFTNLKYLMCYENELTSLDVSKNVALESLQCSSNKLKTLNVSKNTLLDDLDCDKNQLQTLDVSKNTALKELFCGENSLTKLDLTKNTALERLFCYANQLTALDVTKNTKLLYIDCAYNKLTTLDVSKNTLLYNLACGGNKLTSLDVSKNTALEFLYCEKNQLTTLDVSKNTRLEDLECGGNQLTTLKVQSKSLMYLDCGGNKLTTLDLSKCTGLKFLNMSPKFDMRKNSSGNLYVDLSPVSKYVTLPSQYDLSDGMVDGAFGIDENADEEDVRFYDATYNTNTRIATWNMSQLGARKYCLAVFWNSDEDPSSDTGCRLRFEVNQVEGLSAPVVTRGNDPATGKPKLTWKAVSGAAKYEIYRYDSASNTYVKMISTTGTTFTNTSAVAGKTYSYKVKAIGSSSSMTSITAPISVTCKYPTPKVVGSNNPVTGKNVLNWAKVTGATKYEIYRYDSASSSYIKLITTSGTTFTNTSAKPGYIYYYKVKAIGSVAAAASNFSDKVKLTCKYPTPKVVGSNNPVTGKNVLNWEKVDGATKYEIYRYDSASNSYIKLITTAGTTFTNTSAKPGYIYYYKVKAIGSVADAASNFSDKVKLTCKCATPKVTGSNTTTGKPKLTWDAVAGATKYEVYRYDSTSNTYVKYYTTTATSFNNTSAQTGVTYYYKVKALGATTASDSAMSEKVKVTCK